MYWFKITRAGTSRIGCSVKTCKLLQDDKGVFQEDMVFGVCYLVG